jgi:sugar phosphate isomerase/epimerase
VARFRIAVNMEFVRSADLDFRKGVRVAAQLGYRFIEPMVHTGWGLLSEVGYFHSFSMEEDPMLMREICDEHGVSVASLSAHSPLMKPEAAVDRLTRAIVLAHFVGTDIINSDEMLQPTLDGRRLRARHHALHPHAHRAGGGAAPAYLCIEPHGVFTKTSAGLLRIVELVPSLDRRELGHRQQLPGGAEDPYEALMAVRDHVSHVHAKDIDLGHAERERGKVTGTPVGCACGDGVVEWDRVLEILDPLDRDITLSVECGTIDQAERSLAFMRRLLAGREADG